MPLLFKFVLLVFGLNPFDKISHSLLLVVSALLLLKANPLLVTLNVDLNVSITIQSSEVSVDYKNNIRGLNPV